MLLPHVSHILTGIHGVLDYRWIGFDSQDFLDDEVVDQRMPTCIHRPCGYPAVASVFGSLLIIALVGKAS